MDLGKRSDFVTGICVAAFGGYVIIASSRLAYISEYGPGPGFLPLWLGIGLFGLSLALIASNLAHRSLATTDKSETSVISPRALYGWLALICAIFLLTWIGFALALVLLTGFLIVALERRSIWTAASIALALGAGFHLIFVYLLGVSLPKGPWGF